MIACAGAKTQVLLEPGARSKVANLPAVVHELLTGGGIEVPKAPGRDVQILAIRELPAKKGLASREGQARLLHDLASIELQAMELGVRTLAEFPDAPMEFREQLAAVTLDEGRHLELCLNALEELKIPWGSFPTHLGLWNCVASEDSLLDRIVIVHRYLEGAGLDASATLMRRLDGVSTALVRGVVGVIRDDEAGHVEFGSRWYRLIAREAGVDPDQDFEARLSVLFHRIPRRLEPICRATRLKVGFTEREIEALEELRLRWLDPKAKRVRAAVDRADGVARCLPDISL